MYHAANVVMQFGSWERFPWVRRCCLKSCKKASPPDVRYKARLRDRFPASITLRLRRPM